jgi:hypothetical protein
MTYTHIQFIEIAPNPKTKRFSELGFIEWYTPWRCYTFYPYQDKVWSWDCLKEVSDFIKDLMEKRKKENNL